MKTKRNIVYNKICILITNCYIVFFHTLMIEIRYENNKFIIIIHYINDARTDLL